MKGEYAVRLRLRLSWTSENQIPIHYHAMVQAAIYHTLEPSLAAFIHDHGIAYQARQFRLFTFSRLMGPYRLSSDKQWIHFTADSELVISSPLDSLLQSLARRLLDHSTLRIASSAAEAVEIHAEKTPMLHAHQVTLRTLSPIVVYNTMLRPDQRKYTLYRAPNEPEFGQLIESNLRHKAAALAQWGGGQPLPNPSRPLAIRVHQSRLHVMKYRDIIIKGHSGTFTLTGDPSLLRLGIDSGLGSKNAQGFGCVAWIQASGERKEGQNDATRYADISEELS